MQGRAIVASHHKTGSVWMATTFRGICRALNIPCRSVQHARREWAKAPPPIVLLDNHAIWHRRTGRYRRPEDRVFHLIRDPRDVIISAMHYHRIAGEGWLRKPQKEFGGLTYREKINSLEDDRARYIFEMDNSAGRVISAMREWLDRRPECFECKYEDLIADTRMTLFTQAALYLGFAHSELDVCRTQFWEHSLFGGRSAAAAANSNGQADASLEGLSKREQRRQKKKMKREQSRMQTNPRASHVHIRSGAARQWPDVFDRALAEAFIRRFGDVLITLGYEKDNSWVNETEPALVQGFAPGLVLPQMRQA